VALEQVVPEVVVLTQNVDGFHTQAGSSEVIEIHGNLHRLRCVGCAWRDEVDDYSHLLIPPKCPDCGTLIRPDVVLFGEMLPLPAVSTLDRHLRKGFDVVFSIGTTSVFPYIADPIIRARHHQRLTVEINPGDTQVSHLVRHRIRDKAGGFLTQLSTDVLRF
jgi:NAD-dependent deacetylase